MKAGGGGQGQEFVQRGKGVCQKCIRNACIRNECIRNVLEMCIKNVYQKCLYQKCITNCVLEIVYQKCVYQEGIRNCLSKMCVLEMHQKCIRNVCIRNKCIGNVCITNALEMCIRYKRCGTFKQAFVEIGVNDITCSKLLIQNIIPKYQVKRNYRKYISKT